MVISPLNPNVKLVLKSNSQTGTQAAISVSVSIRSTPTYSVATDTEYLTYSSQNQDYEVVNFIFETLNIPNGSELFWSMFFTDKINDTNFEFDTETFTAFDEGLNMILNGTVTVTDDRSNLMVKYLGGSQVRNQFIFLKLFNDAARQKVVALSPRVFVYYKVVLQES